MVGIVKAFTLGELRTDLPKYRNKHLTKGALGSKENASRVNDANKELDDKRLNAYVDNGSIFFGETKIEAR